MNARTTQRHHVPGRHEHWSRRSRLLPDHRRAAGALRHRRIGAGERSRSRACAVTEPWLTTFRSSVTYTIPQSTCSWLARSDRHRTRSRRRSTRSSRPTARLLAANYNVTSQILQRSTIGRPLAPGLAFQTVDLTLPGEVYPDRVNSVDMRVAKVLRFGGYRTDVGFDFYNLFNANTGTAFNQVYDVHQRRELAETDDGAQSTLCAVQLHGEFLTHEGHEGREVLRGLRDLRGLRAQDPRSTLDEIKRPPPPSADSRRRAA